MKCVLSFTDYTEHADKSERSEVRRYKVCEADE